MERNELCYEIEKLPASEQQTKVSLLACEMVNKMEEMEKKLWATRDELREQLRKPFHIQVEERRNLECAIADLTRECQELRDRLKAAEDALRFISTTDDAPENGNLRLPLSRDGMKAAANFALAKYEQKRK